MSEQPHLVTAVPTFRKFKTEDRGYVFTDVEFEKLSNCIRQVALFRSGGLVSSGSSACDQKARRRSWAGFIVAAGCLVFEVLATFREIPNLIDQLARAVTQTIF